MKCYFGISYPKIFSNGTILKLWERFMCRKGCHLFDEVWSCDHYLYCDACGLSVGIKHIQEYET
jgi:hypothetical protein